MSEDAGCDGRSLNDLLDGALAAGAGIESSIQSSLVGRSSVVVGQVDGLVSATLVLQVGRCGHLTPEGVDLAGEGNGAQGNGELHVEHVELIGRLSVGVNCLSKANVAAGWTLGWDGRVYLCSFVELNVYRYLAIILQSPSWSPRCMKWLLFDTNFSRRVGEVIAEDACWERVAE